MTTSLLRTVALTAVLGSGLSAVDLAKEKELVDGTKVPLTNKSELTFNARNDSDVKLRELWYRRRGGDGWGSWQKHAVDYGPQTPISWQPAEGHWQITVRIVEISGAATPKPDAGTEPAVEFIVDRSKPAVDLDTPPSGAVFSTGKPYTITWKADDQHLHSTPINLYFSRSAEGDWIPIAEKLPNNGSYKWTTPSDMANNARLKIEAYDKVLNRSVVINDGMTIDGVAPHCSILSPRTSAALDLSLDVKATDAGPAREVQSVQLWFSANGGTNWSAGPTAQGPDIETINWNAPGDGVYQLALIGSDTAGNANTVPSNPADSDFEILVDATNPTVSLENEIGVVEAIDTADAGRRVFKPGDKVLVPFSVDDLKLANKPVSVAFQTDPAAPWDTVGSDLPADKPFIFSLPDVGSKKCRVKVIAVDEAGNIGEAVSTKTFTIDNEVETGDVGVDL